MHKNSFIYENLTDLVQLDTQIQQLSTTQIQQLSSKYQLHRFKCTKYILYRDSNWNDKYKSAHEKAKKEYAQYQKFAEKERANIKFKELSDLFEANVNGFWREVKKMTQLKQIINIPLYDIKKQYDVLFNTNNFPDEERDKNEEIKLQGKIDQSLKKPKIAMITLK